MMKANKNYVARRTPSLNNNIKTTILNARKLFSISIMKLSNDAFKL